MVLLIKNWLDFIKHHTGLFVLMILGQLITVVCIYFVYGVFQNNLYTLLEGEHDSYRLAASFSGDGDGILLRDFIKEMAENWGLDIDFVYLVAKDKSGNEFQDRVSYQNGHFTYSDTIKKNVQGDMEGEFAGQKQYDSGEKVVVINGDLKRELGEKIMLGGENYRIIGINKVNEKQEYEMPFTAFPDEAELNYISVSLKNLPTREEYNRFEETLRAYNADVEEFAIANQEDIKKHYSLLLVSVILALLSGGNLYLVYCYIFRQRKEQIVAYRLCGCATGYARRMFFGEIFLNMWIAVLIGFFMFRFVCYPLLLNWYEYLYRIYGGWSYFLLTAIYAGITALFGWGISRKMGKMSPTGFRREE